MYLGRRSDFDGVCLVTRRVRFSHHAPPSPSRPPHFISRALALAHPSRSQARRRHDARGGRVPPARARRPRGRRRGPPRPRRFRHARLDERRCVPLGRRVGRVRRVGGGGGGGGIAGGGVLGRRFGRGGERRPERRRPFRFGRGGGREQRGHVRRRPDALRDRGHDPARRRRRPFGPDPARSGSGSLRARRRTPPRGRRGGARGPLLPPRGRRGDPSRHEHDPPPRQRRRRRRRPGRLAGDGPARRPSARRHLGPDPRRRPRADRGEAPLPGVQRVVRRGPAARRGVRRGRVRRPKRQPRRVPTPRE